MKKPLMPLMSIPTDKSMRVYLLDSEFKTIPVINYAVLRLKDLKIGFGEGGLKITNKEPIDFDLVIDFREKNKMDRDYWASNPPSYIVGYKGNTITMVFIGRIKLENLGLLDPRVFEIPPEQFVFSIDIDEELRDKYYLQTRP